MKKIIIGILIIIFAYILFHYRSVQYGLQQAYGQIKILNSAVPLDQYLADENVPDSIRIKIELIQSVKKFAQDSLGLKPTDSYNSIYNQKGKPILWMVTASPEFELKAYEWTFPIAGSFAYKGFFEIEKANAEIESLKKKSYDTELGEVSAWSTLGWLSDPILTSMLEKDSGRLADLIIHELCHASIYLKDSVELNENLASFIGRKGAEQYLSSIGDSTSIIKMQNIKSSRKNIGQIIRNGAHSLDSLYKSYSTDLSLEEKREQKKKMIDHIRWSVAEELADGDSTKVEEKFISFTPNNAYFTGYLTYRSKKDHFENELKETYNGNLNLFIEYYIDKYGD